MLEEQIQDLPSQPLDARRFRRKNVLDVLWKQPAHELRAQRRTSRPTSIDDRPTKRIWPSVICVMRRNVSRQRLGAMNGSTPSRMSISASARRKVVPIAHFLVDWRPKASLR